jgi:hypothetical protein
MLAKGSIAFYINGPTPISLDSLRVAKNTDETPAPPTNPTSPDLKEPKVEHNNPTQPLITKNKNTLLTFRSMRIFDFFPDKLIVDENKVSFIYKDAFGVKSIHSVLVENITYVEAHISFFCGSIVVIDSSNYRHPIELRINNIRKDAALRARKLIQGLVHAKMLQADLSKYTAFDLENNLEELGKVEGED